MERWIPAYFCLKEGLGGYISGSCWTWICPPPHSELLFVFVHVCNLFYKSLILLLWTEAGVLTPMFDTTFTSKVSLVAFSSGLSPYFFNLWSFPKPAFYWHRRKIGKELKTNSRYPHSKFHLVSSLLFSALGFALCINEGVRVDLPGVLHCSTTTIFLQGKALSKELVSFTGLLSKPFNNGISSVTFLGKKINHISWQSEKKSILKMSLIISLPSHRGDNCWGMKTEDGSPIRGSEFAC